MPHKFQYVDGKNTFIFTLSNKILALHQGYQKSFNQFLISTFATMAIPTLSKMLLKYYKLRLNLKSSNQHAFLINKLTLEEHRYIIGITGIAKTFEIPKVINKKLNLNSYVVVNHALSNNKNNAAAAATRFILDSVKNNLFTYCKEIAECLDKEKGVIGKYHKVPNHDGMNSSIIDKLTDSEKRNNFLKGIDTPNFSEFYSKLKNILLKISPSDIDCINDEKPTDNAKAFLSCVNILDAAGFYNVNDKPINFWSGPEAQKQADETLTSLSDSNVPAISIMLHLGNLLIEKRPLISKILCGGGSAIFAAQAKGHVVGFNSSSYNENEGIVLTVGNFHWDNELPILKTKKRLGEIQSLKVSFYDRIQKTWHEPIDLDKKADNIQMRRRTPYISSNKALHDHNPSIYHWPTNAGRSRPSISVAKFKNFVNIWRFYKKQTSAENSAVAKAIISWKCFHK